MESGFIHSNWAILTATQEALGSYDNEKNLLGNKELSRQLKSCGYYYIVLNGCYAGTAQGDSFLVMDMPELMALEFGKRYRQESILTRNGLVMCENGKFSGLNYRKTLIGERAKQVANYSTFPDGSAFSLSLGGYSLS